jgi:hypothetical protein
MSQFKILFKRRLNFGDAFYHSVQNLLSSQLIYKTIILPVALYGCETWSLLRRIFGPTRDEVAGEWRKLHNEELRDLYSSPSIIRVAKLRRVRWVEWTGTGGELLWIWYRTLGFHKMLGIYGVS